MLHVEHLVVGVVIVNHVKTRTNIGGERPLGHKLQGDLVSFGRYTVSASVLLVGTLNLVSDRIVLVGIEQPWRECHSLRTPWLQSQAGFVELLHAEILVLDLVSLLTRKQH